MHERLIGRYTTPAECAGILVRQYGERAAAEARKRAEDVRRSERTRKLYSRTLDVLTASAEFQSHMRRAAR